MRAIIMSFLMYFYFVFGNQRGNVPDPQNPNPTPSPAPTPKPEPKKTIQKRGASEPLKSKTIGKGSGGLFDRFQSQSANADRSQRAQSEMEEAIKFNYGLPDFMKTHGGNLPDGVKGIVELAEKENYSSQREKSGAIKSAIIQAFFEVQENYNLLTSSQKLAVDSYLKLTKNGREAKANQAFTNLLEPALNTLQQVKKASDVNKVNGGKRSLNEGQSAYKDKLQEQAFKARNIKGE